MTTVGIIYLGNTHGVMVVILGNRHGDPSSNKVWGFCLSNSANTLGKGMSLTILPPAMCK